MPHDRRILIVLVLAAAVGYVLLRLLGNAFEARDIGSFVGGAVAYYVALNLTSGDGGAR